MGYRHYFYEADRFDVAMIRTCSNEQLLKYCKNNNKEYDDDGWISIHGLFNQKKIFEFGKYYENAEEIYKLGTPLFINEDVQSRFDDYSPYIVTKDALMSAINWQVNKIKEYYESLLEDDDKNGFNPLTKEQKMQRYVESKVHEWSGQFGVMPFWLKDESDFLVRSWLYEYTIFELVKIQREFDWDNKVLLFYGW